MAHPADPLQVVCPSCGVVAGAPCMVPLTGQPREPHWDRGEIARLAAAGLAPAWVEAPRRLLAPLPALLPPSALRGPTRRTARRPAR